MIRFACPHCGKSLTVAETASGKSAKCPGCHTTIRVPAAAPPPAPAAAVTPARKPRPAPPPPRPAIDEDENQDEGFSETPQRRRPPAARSPGRARDDDPDDNEFDNDVDDPVSKRKKKPKRRKKRAAHSFALVEMLGPYVIAMIAIALFTFLTLGLSLVWPKILVLTILVGTMVWVGGWIWFIAVAFGEGGSHGALCLLVPFYALFFLASHVEETRKPAGAWLLGVLIVVIAGLFGDIADSREVAHDFDRPPVAVAPHVVQNLGQKVVEGDVEVYYTGEATLADARALSRCLSESNLFLDWNLAQLTKQNNVFIVSVPLSDDDWEDLDDLMGDFRQLRAEISRQAFAGAAVEIRLCNQAMVAKRTIR